MSENQPDTPWDVERRKPVRARQLFPLGMIADALARRPRRLEYDKGESKQIGYDFVQKIETGEFGNNNVFILISRAPYFFEFLPILEETCLRGVWDPAHNEPVADRTIEHGRLYIRELILTRDAVRAYLDRCGLEGAPRLLWEWFGDHASLSETPAQDTLRPAPTQEIHDAITAVYDEAAAAGKKPPNVRQVVRPVQEKLRVGGYEASGNHIQTLAGDDLHKNRRRKPGPTVTSEKRQASP